MTKFEDEILDGFLASLYKELKNDKIDFHWNCYSVIEHLVNKHPSYLGPTNYDMGLSRQSIKDRLNKLLILRKI